MHNIKYIKDYLAIQSIKIDNKIKKFLDSTKDELGTFFDFKVAEPLVYLVDSRKSLDLIWGKPTENWFVGGARDNCIYILNPEVFSVQSSHKNPAEFWQVLKHEYCHIYYKQITGTSYPLWLNEGLANYLAGQEKIGGNPLAVFKYFDKGGNEVYRVGYFWVKLLLDRFGDKKLKELVVSLKAHSVLTESKFAVAFKKTYKVDFNEKGLKTLLVQ